MGRKTRRQMIEETVLLCDILACEKEANGPCLLCGADVCEKHGGLEPLPLYRGGQRVYVCEECRKTKRILVLYESLTGPQGLNDAWGSFFRRRGDRGRRVLSSANYEAEPAKHAAKGEVRP